MVATLKSIEDKMDHTYIVTANDLDRYSDTRDSEAVIPELIDLFVKQCVPHSFGMHLLNLACIKKRVVLASKTFGI